MTDQHTSQKTQVELHTEEPADRSEVTARSRTDEMVAGMIRTMEKIQRDPLLHYRLSQRGF